MGKHRKDWPLDGIAASIKEHAARKGFSYLKTSILVKTGRLTKTWAERYPPKPPNPLDAPRLCLRCGVSYRARCKQQKWCSAKCRHPKAAARPVKIKPAKPRPKCLVCGTRTPPFCRKFCSRKCRKKSKRIKERKNPPLGWDVTHEPANCNGCASDGKTTPLPIPRNYMTLNCDRCRKYGPPARRRKAKNAYCAKRRTKDPAFLMRQRLSCRLRELCSKLGIQKSNSITAYLGCSPTELIAHLESKFLPGMTWENYGVHGWHVDHHVPCAAFNLLREDHRQVCFHHSNLRPLWAMDNSSKGDTIHADTPQQLKDMAFSVGVLIL